MSRSELTASRWLEAHSDRSAGLTTLPRNLILADVCGDGDHRLLLIDLKIGQDFRSRLKVYKGTVLVSDQALPDIPSGIISFYTDEFDPKIPAVAVACGPDLLIYKNNKPYFKFSVPNLPVPAIEQDVWKRLENESDMTLGEVIKNLRNVSFGTLSSRSQHLLSLSPEKQEEMITKYAGSEPIRITNITCMTTIHKNHEEQTAMANPVIATESGQIYILDPQTFTILHQASVSNLKTTPCIMTSSGLYEVEFRLIIASRENYVCVLRRGWLEGKVILQTTSAIVDILFVPGDNFIYLATTEKMFCCYTKSGNKLWSVKLKNSVTCLSLVPLKHYNVSLIAVGLRGAAIQLYQGRHPVDYIPTPDAASAITFGQLGQEEHVMVIVTLGGTINFKILKRTADFNLTNHDSTTFPATQNKPLPLPKRSKLFMEHSIREQQNSIEMHQSFQQDLLRLRLNAARAVVQLQSDQSAVGNEKEEVKLSAQVFGLGPKFTLTLILENMNTEKALIGLSVIFHCKPSVYRLSAYLMKVPLVPPGLAYKIQTNVTEINFLNDNNDNIANITAQQIIRVFVFRIEQTQPVLAATINMPPTDPLGFGL